MVNFFSGNNVHVCTVMQAPKRTENTNYQKNLREILPSLESNSQDQGEGNILHIAVRLHTFAQGMFYN